MHFDSSRMSTYFSLLTAGLWIGIILGSKYEFTTCELVKLKCVVSNGVIIATIRVCSSSDLMETKQYISPTSNELVVPVL